MSVVTLLNGWTVPPKTKEVLIRRYSINGDILTFKRCRRQYGYFSVRGFSSATATFRYFGTLMHDVLDRIQRDYRRSLELPDEGRIRELVEEAHNRLVRSGIRPYHSRRYRTLATSLIYRFVVLFGSSFFPYVKETEYRLDRTLRTYTGRDYVLDGVVDVLSGSISHALGLEGAKAGDTEIWDYKSGKRPEESSRLWRDYEYQMYVYAELFRQQTGKYPSRTILVFLNELAESEKWKKRGHNPRDFPNLLHAIQPDPHRVRTAMLDFHQTVEEIEAERSRPYHEQWQPPPPSYEVAPETCRACELRYSCRYYLHRNPSGERERVRPL